MWVMSAIHTIAHRLLRLVGERMLADVLSNTVVTKRVCLVLLVTAIPHQRFGE
jgi:hypothetical protein